ncbi:MAG: hypothetical protein ACYCX4_14985 [Bacillota bacterium]
MQDYEAKTLQKAKAKGIDSKRLRWSLEAAEDMVGLVLTKFQETIRDATMNALKVKIKLGYGGV